jgi:preprotein translocase subunit SecE
VSKEREGHEGEDLDPTAGAEDVNSTDDISSDADEVVSDDAGTADITDPESEAPDADEIEAELEAAAEDVDADGTETVGSVEDEAAVGAGSYRAALRKSGARAGVTEKKATATRAQNANDSRSNVFTRLGRFLREVVAELRKVIWPSQKQMVTYTIVVISFLVFMVALVSGLDVLFHFGVGNIFG